MFLNKSCLHIDYGNLHKIHSRISVVKVIMVLIKTFAEAQSAQQTRFLNESVVVHAKVQQRR